MKAEREGEIDGDFDLTDTPEWLRMPPPTMESLPHFLIGDDFAVTKRRLRLIMPIKQSMAIQQESWR